MSLNQKCLAILIGLAVVAVALTLILTPAAHLRNISPQTIEYAIHPSVQGTDRELLTNATKQAAAMWSDLNPGLEFVLTDKQNVLQIKAHIPAHVDMLVNALKSGPTNGYAECRIWDTDATTCTVYIHPYFLSADTIDLSPAPRINTVAHELGHVLGLSHYPDTLMNHLMGTPTENPAGTSTDAKGYVVPDPLP